VSERVWTLRPTASGYPECLRVLDEPKPPKLYGVGGRETVSALDEHATVTIVGSRHPSSYGIRIAEQLAFDLACAGVSVVSGMAIGIDSAAHRGALDAGGTTIAVLACGPDVVYPPRERRLYRRIVETGAVVSEYPPGEGARRHQFPARNRIMAAFGRAVVVVEATDPSGSLITADLALKFGRTVGAVPGQVGVRAAEGTNRLIKDGAHLVRDAQDVLDLIFGVGVGHAPDPPDAAEAPDEEAGEPRRSPLEPARGPRLDPSLRPVLELIEQGVVTADRLALEGGLQPQDAAIALTRLELLGYVELDPAGGMRRSHLRVPQEAGDE
jgi:DNA processing protein